jgi:hypothetical protein
MTYKGRVEHGVVILEGSHRPPEGAIVRVEEELPGAVQADHFVPPTDAELAAWMKEMEELAVDAPHADDSRAAIYTRMPDE